MSHLSYAEAVVTGLIQGVTELFPVSSLGHNVLLPALIGGQWAKDLSVSAKGSPYLAFIVGLHVATALAMILYFWRDWVRIVRGFFSSLRRREIVTADQRLAWMIVLATIPVGIAGAALQKVFTNVFARPELTALFLAANGLILLYSERQRRARAGRGSGARTAEPVVAGGPAQGGYQGYSQQPQGYPQQPQGYPQQPEGYWQQPQQQQWQGPWQEPWQEPGPRQQPDPWGERRQGPDPRAGQTPRAGAHRADPRADQTGAAVAADRRLSLMGYGKAILVGAAQILALLPGISRDGIVTVAGMGRGLSREDAVRFSFLLSAPVILAAGLLKAHDLLGPAGKGIHGPVLVGSLLSFIGAYLSVRFLTRYFSESRSLNPFGVYCLVAGLLSFAYLLIK
jgi:undecaprenyl-diphosphatase